MTINFSGAKNEIKYLTISNEIKNHCTDLLKTEVKVSKQLDRFDQLNEKISDLGSWIIVFQENEQSAPERSLAGRIGKGFAYGLGGVGAILLCPISWVAGIVLGVLGIFGGGKELFEVSGKCFGGPVILAGRAFFECVNSKYFWSNKANKFRMKQDDLTIKRTNAINEIKNLQTEMDDIAVRVDSVKDQIPNLITAKDSLKNKIEHLDQ